MPFLKKFNFPSWSEHLKSWIDSNVDCCLFSYSDLINDFDNQIINLCNFLNLEINNEKIKIIKNNTSFTKLKNIEIKERDKNLGGFFSGNTRGKKTSFMNFGKNDNYSTLLNNDQIEKLKNSFHQMIKKYNL